MESHCPHSGRHKLPFDAWVRRILVTEDEHAVLLLVVAVRDDVLHELGVFSDVLARLESLLFR